MREFPLDSDPDVIGTFTVVQMDPKLDHDTGVQATSKDGRRRKWALLSLYKRAAQDGFEPRPELETVVVSSAEAPKVQIGHQVRFLGLVGRHWEMEVKPGAWKSGVSLSADGVEPVSTASKREA